VKNSCRVLLLWWVVCICLSFLKIAERMPNAVLASVAYLNASSSVLKYILSPSRVSSGSTWNFFMVLTFNNATPL